MMVDTCLRSTGIRMVVALLFVFSCLLSWIPGSMSAEVVVIRVGGVARLNCSTTTNGSVEWKRVLPKGSPSILGYIYVDSWLQRTYEEGGRHNVSLDPLTGACDLVIKNVTEDDAGKYYCTETKEKRYLELVVLLVDNPTCRTNINLTNVLVDNDCDIDPDYIEFNCSIAYRGNVAPDMQLQMSSIGVLDNVTVSNWTQSTTKYMSVVWASKASWRMGDGRFRCEVTNTMVDVQPTCSSTQVSIIYFYKTNITVKITSNEENQSDCAANTNTSEHCIFRWRGTHRDSSKSSNHSEVFGPIMDLKNRDVGLSSMRCRAECRIRNKSCVSESMFIEFLSGGDSSPVWIILGIVCSIVVLLIGVACLCIYIKWERSRVQAQPRPRYEKCSDVVSGKNHKSGIYDHLDLKNCIPLEIVESFEKVKKELKDYIDLGEEFLNELCKRKIIFDSEISNQEELLNKISSAIKLNPDKIIQFLEALCEDQQGHIAKFIFNDGRKTDSVERLLPRKMRQIIDDNIIWLLELIDTEKLEFLHKLVDEKCITTKHQNRVTRSGTSELFIILKRRRYKDFWSFIFSLKETRQQHIAEILEKGGVAEFEVKLEKQNDGETIQIGLIKKLTGFVVGDNKSDLTKDQEERIRTKLAELKEKAIYFIGACLGTSNAGSISVFLQVRKGEPSSVLKSESELLKQSLEEMFRALQENNSPLVEDVEMKIHSPGQDIVPRKYACAPSTSFKTTNAKDFEVSLAGSVKEIILFLWMFSGDKKVIGGIKATYDEDPDSVHGLVDHDLTPETFTLQPQEKIVSVDVRCGFLLDALTFRTSKGKKRGPYGGTDQGAVYRVEPSEGGFLAYLKGTVEELNGCKIIRNLEFVWN